MATEPTAIEIAAPLYVMTNPLFYHVGCRFQHLVRCDTSQVGSFFVCPKCKRLLPFDSAEIKPMMVQDV